MRLKLHAAVIAVYCAHCVGDIFNVKAGGTYTYQCCLKDSDSSAHTLAVHLDTLSVKALCAHAKEALRHFQLHVLCGVAQCTSHCRLDAFAELSSCQSVRMQQLISQWTDFHEFDI